MKELKYKLLDVFTDHPFGGNPLAVFPEADELSGSIMQSIANELNLAETTFIQSPQRPDSDCRVRIFTPQKELPMAGHPTIGTAHTILDDAILTPKNKDYLLFDEGVGQIRVDIKQDSFNRLRLAMHQPLPEYLSKLDHETIAAMLSLHLSDLVSNMPVQIVSCGIPMIIVPVRTLEAVQRINLRLDLIEQHLAEAQSQEFFAFTRETTTTQSHLHCRFFAPRFGVPEDAATGSAYGPVGSYLYRYESNCPKQFVSEQGIEMGRPSRIYVDIRDDDKNIIDVIVGGHCVPMGSGCLRLSDVQ